MAKQSETFEIHLGALETIVEELESGELDLEASLARYQEGVKRLKSCYGMLKEAERKVTMLVRGVDGELAEQPFGDEEP